MSIGSINGVNTNPYVNYGKTNNVNFKAKETTKPLFEDKKEEKVDASNDGKFTGKEALRNFGKGLISPLKALIDHPLLALGTLAVTGLACFAIPALTPILTIGFGALSLYEVGKGTYEAAKNYRKGEYDAAEKSFEKIGTGTIGTILTAVGLKSSAKVAAEVKQANQLGRMLTKTEKVAIAKEVQQSSMLSALKENLSIITTAQGRSALIAGFKPKNIVAQFKSKSHIVEPKKFEETAEGQRRANMTSKDIEREVTEIANQAFDEMGIPKEARPKIVISDELRYQTIDDANATLSNIVDEKIASSKWSFLDKDKYVKGSYKREFFRPGENLREMSNDDIIARIKSVLSQTEDTQKFAKDEYFLKSLLNEQKINEGGFYTTQDHQIVFKTGGWRKGRFTTEDTAVHEALHAKMAILRNSLTKEEAAQIIKQELVNRIKFGEPEQVLVSGGWLGNEMMAAPKMSANMRTEYLQFADDFLYKSDDLINAITEREQILTRMKGLKDGSSICNTDTMSGLTAELAKADDALKPIITRLKTMIQNNPEFVAQNGGSEAEALNTLLKYTKSHEVRFKYFSNTEIKGVKPIPLTPEQHQQAVESLVGHIETIEGNSRTGGFTTRIFGASKAEFNQYQFSYEELLARNTAAQFEKAKLQAMLQDTTLSAEKQAELSARIKDLDFVLEYNRVGKQYYDLYTRAINNPNDTAIADELSAVTTQFEKLDNIKNSLRSSKPEVYYKTYGVFPLNMTPYLPKKEAA